MSSEVDFQCSSSSEISIQNTSYHPYRVNRRTSQKYKNLLRQTSSIDEEISVENGKYRITFVIEKGYNKSCYENIVSFHIRISLVNLEFRRRRGYAGTEKTKAEKKLKYGW